MEPLHCPLTPPLESCEFALDISLLDDSCVKQHVVRLKAFQRLTHRTKPEIMRIHGNPPAQEQKQPSRTLQGSLDAAQQERIKSHDVELRNLLQEAIDDARRRLEQLMEGPDKSESMEKKRLNAIILDKTDQVEEIERHIEEEKKQELPREAYEWSYFETVDPVQLSPPLDQSSLNERPLSPGVNSSVTMGPLMMADFSVQPSNFHSPVRQDTTEDVLSVGPDAAYGLRNNTLDPDITPQNHSMPDSSTAPSFKTVSQDRLCGTSDQALSTNMTSMSTMALIPSFEIKVETLIAGNSLEYSPTILPQEVSAIYVPKSKRRTARSWPLSLDPLRTSGDNMQRSHSGPVNNLMRQDSMMPCPPGYYTAPYTSNDGF